MSPRPSRRTFLTTMAGGAAVAALPHAAGCSADDADGAPPPSATTMPPGEIGDHPVRFVGFDGVHQAGITARPVPRLGLAASFDVVAADRAALTTMFRDLTDELRGLMAGRPPRQRDPAYPPVDSGLLGDTPRPDNLTGVVAVGASLFDDRYGLAGRRPRELVEMPFLANDRLDPERSHGDVLVVLEAEHPDTLQFAIRQLMRRVRRELVLHWMLDGYSRGVPDPDEGDATPRNLMGFKDGTANLDPGDPAAMDRHVWVQPDDDEPDWTAGGSYLAFRTIRMFVEFWDRTPLAEQEAIIGRHKLSGAPLGADDEHAPIDHGDDPDGRTIPLDAHIRLANPRTEATADSLILRRGFSFSRGFDRAGRLDQGLAFVSYQRSLDRGFRAVQARLTGEPLEEYILPVGGGFFFALPGAPGPDRFLADELVA